jgi:hypothetical protein
MNIGNFGFGNSTTNIYESGLTFKGSWNALTNNPTLTSSVGTNGEYYIVSVAGTTNLNGITDWQIGDWAIFEGASNMWQKIDNHEIQAYTFVQDEGSYLPQQSILDFQGTGVVVTNGSGKTIVTIAGNIPATNYGLYAQTQNSTIITATTTESSLIGLGVGTLSVPANGFSVGDTFRGDFGGLLSAKNNDSIRIRVKAGSILLADSGLQTLPSTTNAIWSLSLNFTIRAIGGAGVSSIVTLANFLSLKQSNTTSEGFGFNSVNNTTFDTTIPNTLVVTAQFSSKSALNSIYSDIFCLNKIY